MLGLKSSACIVEWLTSYDTWWAETNKTKKWVKVEVFRSDPLYKRRNCGLSKEGVYHLKEGVAFWETRCTLIWVLPFQILERRRRYKPMKGIPLGTWEKMFIMLFCMDSTPSPILIPMKSITASIWSRSLRLMPSRSLSQRGFPEGRTTLQNPPGFVCFPAPSASGLMVSPCPFGGFGLAWDLLVDPARWFVVGSSGWFFDPDGSESSWGQRFAASIPLRAISKSFCVASPKIERAGRNSGI